MGIREKLAYGLGGLSLAAGFILLFCSFFYPPEGEIDSSVIYVFGEILVFCGSLMGISLHYKQARGR